MLLLGQGILAAVSATLRIFALLRPVTLPWQQ